MSHFISAYKYAELSAERTLSLEGKSLNHFSERLLAMWRLGFFFHEMAFGLLSVFIPLYVVLQLNGSLVEFGIMTSVALFCGIPASFFWGYICDRTRRYKVYILLSFLSATVILFAFTLTTSVFVFILLFVILQMLHVAHESPKNVLIAEHYSREEWEKSYASYEALTEIGWLLGLLLGFLTAVFSASSALTLYLCAGLNFAAFVLSIFLVADPLMIFERRLVGIERRIDFTYRGVENASDLMDGNYSGGVIKQENFLSFGIALMLFMLATGIFFTPLPIFFEHQLSFPSSMIFLIYMVSSGGAVLGYIVARRRSSYSNAKTQIRRIVLLRGLLVFSLVAAVNLLVSPTVFAGIILVALGFAYAIYYVLMLALSMELVPQGKNAIFDVLVGVGAATGSFLGPYLAALFGFTPTFLLAGSLFLVAFLVLWVFT